MRARFATFIVSAALGVLMLASCHGTQPTQSTPPQPTVAAPSGAKCSPNSAPCYKGYFGGDPKYWRCDEDARTIDRKEDRILVEVRYSPRCKAVWGKLTRAKVGDRINITANGVGVATATVNWGHTKYSEMIPVSVVGSKVTACGFPAGGRAVCTTTAVLDLK